MLDLNRKENNYVDNFMIQNTIKKIAYYINNILIINNIGYFKELLNS